MCVLEAENFKLQLEAEVLEQYIKYLPEEEIRSPKFKSIFAKEHRG